VRNRTALMARKRRAAAGSPEQSGKRRRAAALHRREPWRRSLATKASAGSSKAMPVSMRTQSGGRRNVTSDDEEMPWSVANDGSPACGGDKPERAKGLGSAC
jgi:hypothetical protein